MATMSSILARLHGRIVAAVLGTIVMLLFAIMCLEVLFRYGFNNSLIWAEEVCRYLLVWLTFLAAGPAYARGQVTAVRLLDGLMPPRAVGATMVAANLLSLFLLAVVIRYGWRYAAFGASQPMPAADFIWTDVFGGTGSTGITLFWVYVAVPVGAAVLAATILVDTVRVARAALAGARPVPPGAEAAP